MTQALAAAATSTRLTALDASTQRARRRAGTISPQILCTMLRTLEFAAVALLGIAIASVYLEDLNDVFNTLYLSTILGTAAASVIAFQILGLYAPARLTRIPEQISGVAGGLTIAMALVLSAVFFAKLGIEYSRLWLALWYAASIATLSAGRIALARRAHIWAREGRLYRRAVIYGATNVAADVVAKIRSTGACDTRITGLFDDRVDGRDCTKIAGLPLLGGTDELIQHCRDERTDIVIVALPVAGEHRFNDVVSRLSVLPAEIKLPAQATRIRFSPRMYSHIGPVAMIDLFDKPITDWGRVTKWLFDTIIAGLAIVLLAPVMLWVAFNIKRESKGPILFKQKRYGFNNELIEVYKFRSMYTDMCDANAQTLVTKEDPRVTPFGRFIRKTSLDELPQLFNVIKGDLSLVGPRPHALSAKAGGQLYDDVVDGYFARHKVKPGITGWAQINGWRGETDTEEKIQKRVEHDLYYIENWSVFLDLYILLKTPLTLISNKNAY
jgi:Undecaprenyl-phosphate glucose phosphotransferase